MDTYWWYPWSLVVPCGPLWSLGVHFRSRNDNIFKQRESLELEEYLMCITL